MNKLGENIKDIEEKKSHGLLIICSIKLFNSKLIFWGKK